MLKCMANRCGKEAEFIYLGKSLCTTHFKKLQKDVAEAQKKAEPRKTTASDDVKAAYDLLSNARFKLNTEGKINQVANKACNSLDKIAKALRPMKEDLTHAGY